MSTSGGAALLHGANRRANLDTHLNRARSATTPAPPPRLAPTPGNIRPPPALPLRGGAGRKSPPRVPQHDRSSPPRNEENDHAYPSQTRCAQSPRSAPSRSPRRPCSARPRSTSTVPKLTATLSGAEEVAGAGDTNGAGLFEARINTERGRICYSLSAGNIGPRRPGATLHLGAAGTSGDPVLTLDRPDGDDEDSEECQDIDRALAAAILREPGRATTSRSAATSSPTARSAASSRARRAHSHPPPVRPGLVQGREGKKQA